MSESFSYFKCIIYVKLFLQDTVRPPQKTINDDVKKITHFFCLNMADFFVLHVNSENNFFFLIPVCEGWWACGCVAWGECSSLAENDSGGIGQREKGAGAGH